MAQSSWHIKLAITASNSFVCFLFFISQYLFFFFNSVCALPGSCFGKWVSIESWAFLALYNLRPWILFKPSFLSDFLWLLPREAGVAALLLQGGRRRLVPPPGLHWHIVWVLFILLVEWEFCLPACLWGASLVGRVRRASSLLSTWSVHITCRVGACVWPHYWVMVKVWLSPGPLWQQRLIGSG